MSVGVLIGLMRPLSLGQRAAIVAGAVLPDVVDKLILWTTSTTFGRSVGHAPLVWVWLGCVIWLLRRYGRGQWASFVWVGGLSHLLADVYNDACWGLCYSRFVMDAWGAWPYVDSNAFYIKVAAPLWPDVPRSLWWCVPLELATCVITLCVITIGVCRRYGWTNSVRSA